VVGDDDDAVPYSGVINYSRIVRAGGYSGHGGNGGESGGGFFSHLSHRKGRGGDASGRKIVRPKPPKFTISINLAHNTDKLLSSFDYDGNAHNLVVHNEQRYFEFLRKRQERKMDDSRFINFMNKKRFDDLVKLPQLPLIEKIYGKPQEASDFATAIQFLSVGEGSVRQAGL
jgi:hypothetical protein